MSHDETLHALPADQRRVTTALVDALIVVSGVEAIVLGGSHARGAARPDSDVDLGVYYLERNGLDIAAVRGIADRFAGGNETTVTNLYEWGPWVNGGAWIYTSAGKVDLLYRNVDHVRRVIDAATHGQLEWHAGQQPPYGFYNVIYLAETHVCVPLYDPHAVISALKGAVWPYPRAFREAVVRDYLWLAEFTLIHGRSAAARGDVYNVAGCLTRAAALLTQVLFALNEQYFITDKGALESIDGFALHPDGYGDALRALLAQPGATASELTATMDRFGVLFARVVELAPGLYAAKFRL